jgi:hypothetical protein
VQLYCVGFHCFSLHVSAYMANSKARWIGYRNANTCKTASHWYKRQNLTTKNGWHQTRKNRIKCKHESHLSVHTSYCR